MSPKKRTKRKSSEGAITQPAYATSEQINQLACSITQLSTSVKPPIIDKPTFSGNPLEDPDVFIKDVEEVMQTAQTSPSKKTKFAAECLTREAAEWYQLRRDLVLSFEEFKEDFLEHFNHPRILAKISGNYFGKRQQQGEAVAVFLATKQKQAARIQRNAKNDIPTIISLMLPQMELHLPKHPKDLRSLRNVAIDLEEMLKKTGQLPKKSSTKEIKPTEESTLPKCRFCPGRHWHKDCPSRSNPGNA